MFRWNFQPHTLSPIFFEKSGNVELIGVTRQPDIYYRFRNDELYADEQLGQFVPGDD